VNSLSDISSVYLIGIGGIGMSALARYFAQRGMSVAGYDRTASALTDSLVSEGIGLTLDERVEAIPQPFLRTEGTLVIYTPAIPKEHPQLQFFRSNGFELMKRAEVLGLVSEDYRTVAVGGTHGKTTTSSLLTHLLRSSHLSCNAILGGISADYQTNFLSSGRSQLLVTEADEYDRSFLQLHPHIAIVTSVDADHLEIYGTAGQMVEGFREFAERVPDSGIFIHRAGLPFDDLETESRKLSYAVEDEADYRAINVRVENGHFVFDLLMPEGIRWNGLILGIYGRHNVENAVAAIAAATLLGAREEEIRAALASCKGVQRRFEIHLNTDTVAYVDDYAHHPSELDACISAARELFPNRKLTGIFQPHLFSRTRDHLDGFAQSLSKLDELILLEIYPARELPIEGVTSAALLERVPMKEKRLLEKGEVVFYLENNRPDVLLTMGAGDIGRLVAPINQLLA
jgi:UDP-N-acetylmuramate--alanine ligase